MPVTRTSSSLALITVALALAGGALVSAQAKDPVAEMAGSILTQSSDRGGCASHCPGDADNNSIVNFEDIVTVLALWGYVCPGDQITSANYSLIDSLAGGTNGEWFGQAVAGAGDVNNDGFDDIIVGSPRFYVSGVGSAGRVQIFSGASGALLRTFYGNTYTEHFGASVSGAGDVNNDGFDDVIVGGHLDDNNGTDSGSATVFSGKTGGILYYYNGDAAGDQFGTSVKGVGDVNGDGYDDFIIGAPWTDVTGANYGTTRVYSGATGAVLYTIHGSSTFVGSGLAVSGAGDVNADGIPDFIIGARTNRARVYNGATGGLLYLYSGQTSADKFGSSVCGAGDVNNDGYDDFIIGAPNDVFFPTLPGRARVYSGATGLLLHSFEGITLYDRLGHSVSGAGDVNNDGFDDLIVGSYTGRAAIYSGSNGAILYEFAAGVGADGFGRCVSLAGDINNDGFPDMLVGAYWASSATIPNCGKAYIIKSQTFHCPAHCPGDADGSGSVNHDDIGMVLTNWLSSCP